MFVSIGRTGVVVTIILICHSNFRQSCPRGATTIRIIAGEICSPMRSLLSLLLSDITAPWCLCWWRSTFPSAVCIASNSCESIAHSTGTHKETGHATNEKKMISPGGLIYRYRFKLKAKSEVARIGRSTTPWSAWCCFGSVLGVLSCFWRFSWVSHFHIMLFERHKILWGTLLPVGIIKRNSLLSTFVVWSGYYWGHNLKKGILCSFQDYRF